MQEKIKELTSLFKIYFGQFESDKRVSNSKKYVTDYHEFTFTEPVEERKASRLRYGSRDSCLTVNVEQYIKHEWAESLPFIKKIHFQSVVFNEINGILPKIISIRFEGIKTLNLTHCLISSIEVLQNMNLRQLKSLNLSSNAIVSFKPLRKLNCFGLQELDLSKNCFLSLNFIHEMKTRKHMTRITIEQFGHWSCEVEQIRFLWKLQARTVRKMQIQSLERVSNLSFQFQKRQRFNSPNKRI